MLVAVAARVLRVRALLNPAYDAGRGAGAGAATRCAFHRGLRRLCADAACASSAEGVWLKDESNRLGLPAFKVLGASWAVERALRADPDVHTLVAASAGNHGRAVAHVAAQRGLRCRIYLPARSVPARREAIAAEGAEVVVVDGTYEDAVRARPARRRAAGRASSSPTSAPPASASWVIDGYATLFDETRGRVRRAARAGRRRLAGRRRRALGRAGRGRR